MFSQVSRQPNSTGGVANPMGYDFALLGLRAREARVSVIRRAASETAARIHDARVDCQEHVFMLSHVAASTYRLLDPRRRSHPVERVKLSVFSEEDLEQQAHSRRPLVTHDHATPRRVGETLGNYQVTGSAI